MSLDGTVNGGSFTLRLWYLNNCRIHQVLMFINFQDAKLSELEAVTGIRQEMWCRWFSGYYTISGKSLFKAARALGVSAPMLLEQIEARKSAKTSNSAR